MSRMALLLSLAKGPVGCSRRKSQCVKLCKDSYKEGLYNVALLSLQIILRIHLHYTVYVPIDTK